MCKFTYLGYEGCDEPERHYLLRREKCSAKANLKQWCAPHEQEESPAADGQESSWVNLPCPMCAEIPVIYDQPLLEIAHSRRSVLPAPHYDGVTGKYSRFARHHIQNTNTSQKGTPVPAPVGSPENLIPKPLKTRIQLERTASETAVSVIKGQEVSPEYVLPATTYNPQQLNINVPKAFPIPQPATLTPPSSREASLSPPQSRIDASIRAIPPGESSVHELRSLSERAKAAAIASKGSRPTTPERQGNNTDRSRSGSESSNTSSTIPPPAPTPPPPRPSRKISNASSAGYSSVTSSPPSKSSSVSSKTGHQRPQMRSRKEGTTRASPQDSITDSLASAALRSIGLDRQRTDSPERGRRPNRRERGGSSSDRSDSPAVWRPTISPPTLQQDSLGIGANGDIVEPFKHRLVPFRPSKNGNSIARGEGLVEDPPRPKTAAGNPGSGAATTNNNTAAGGATPTTTNNNTTTKTSALSLFPNPEHDEKVAAEAFAKMFETERKAHAYQVQAQAQAMAQAQAQAQVHADAQAQGGSDSTSGSDPYSKAGVARRVEKMLPSVPTALRRIRTGQVKTVTVVPPRRPQRSNTVDSLGSTRTMASSSSSTTSKSSPPQISAPTNFVKVTAGGPLFSFAGVGGGRAQEFEIITGPDGNMLAEPAYGQAF